MLPLAAGLTALGELLVRQYRRRDALMPLKLIMSTVPVTGVGAAMLTGAAFTGLIQLCVTYLLMVRGTPPGTTGALLASQIAGILVAAWLFKALLPTRRLPALTMSGVVLTAIGGVLVPWFAGPGSIPLLVIAVLLLGYGAGAGVSPGLFMAGLSVPSNRLGPTFALVELLRAEAAFLVAPVLLAIAMAAGDLASGIRVAAMILVLATAARGAGLAVLWRLGGVRSQQPDLEGWLTGERTAFDSPRLADAVRE